MTDSEVNLIISRIDSLEHQSSDRFTRIEKQNDDQLALMRRHIQDDEEVKEKVLRHDRYFVHAGRFSKWAGITAVGALLAKLGMK